MTYEFHAHFPFALLDSLTQSAAIEFLAGKRNHPPQAWPELAQIEDDGMRMALLAQTLVTNYKDQARTGTRNDPGGYGYWLRREAGTFLTRQRRWLEALHLTQSTHSLSDLTLLPKGSFTIAFTFTLTSPYLSKDDTALHLLDNPVRKEWVFKLPYMASTQWKGTLQAAMVQQLTDWWQNLTPSQQEERSRQKEFIARRIQLTRLFGTEIEQQQEYLSNLGDERLARRYRRFVRCFISHTGFTAGRLYFYPTFFDRLGLEVINPHDRKTGAGSQPILMECVPAGTTGAFTLLYTPLDRIGQDEAETRQQLLADLQLLAEGLEALFTLYGFGAKTSSGFGLAELTGTGQFAIHHPDTPAATPRPQEPGYPSALRAFLESNPSEYLEMKPKQLKDAGVPNQMREQVKEIKELHRTYQRELADYQASLTEWESAAVTPPSPVTERPFSTFAELADVLGSMGGDA